MMQNINTNIENIGFRRRTINGITEIFPQRMFGIIAIVCLTIALLFVLVLPDTQGFKLTDRIVFIIVIGLLALPLLLFSFVVRYYLDSEKIIFRTMIGIKKILKWKDIRTVKIGINPTKIILYNGKRKIKIYPIQYFGAGSEYLKIIIRKYYPDAEWK